MRPLGRRIGMAGAERRAVEPGPDAAAIGHHNHQPAAAGERTPALRQHRADLLAAFERMDQQDPVDRGILQRQLGLVDQGRDIGAFLGPLQHALGRRHQRHDPLGLAQEGAQIGRGIAQPDQPQPSDIRPELPQPATQHAGRDLTQAGLVKVPEIDDVGVHGGARLARIARREHVRRGVGLVGSLVRRRPKSKLSQLNGRDGDVPPRLGFAISWKPDPNDAGSGCYSQLCTTLRVVRSTTTGRSLMMV